MSQAELDEMDQGAHRPQKEPEPDEIKCECHKPKGTYTWSLYLVYRACEIFVMVSLMTFSVVVVFSSTVNLWLSFWYALVKENQKWIILEIGLLFLCIYITTKFFWFAFWSIIHECQALIVLNKNRPEAEYVWALIASWVCGIAMVVLTLAFGIQLSH